VRVGGFVNLRGVRKLTGENPSPWGALPTDLELVRRVRVRAHLLGPERWCDSKSLAPPKDAKSDASRELGLTVPPEDDWR